jgi:hypothetical protein
MVIFKKITIFGVSKQKTEYQLNPRTDEKDISAIEKEKVK